ncbi:hypothetical protein QYE76_025066 [Lolium multiflorum]|uniref:CCHC-type domain-containing protein n=1 Tax=Lolium multiflorum TaxID=4521 RepID=A0AAD8VUA9_LOLMU|nr:hypothetical protein QYE76_025066 [Lolium multiflorum]
MNYSLLIMGDSSGDEDGGGVDGDAFRGTSPSLWRAGTETSVPGSWLRDGGGWKVSRTVAYSFRVFATESLSHCHDCGQTKDTNLALNLQILTKQADLNADDLVSYVVVNDIMAKAGEKLMAMNRVDGSSHNLALKARADQEIEEAREIEEDEMTSTSDMQTDVAFFVKKYVKTFPISSKEKKRTCYNCDEDSHFTNECPYEKRVDKPKFVKGVKPRLKPNPINERYKNNKGRAFVGAEYISDERGRR